MSRTLTRHARSCRCLSSEARSVACCFEHDWKYAADITFPANGALDRKWNVRAEVVTDILDAVLKDQLLTRDVWTEKAFSFAPPMQTGERYELRRMYLFDPEHTVREYSEDEVRVCYSRV